MTAQPLTRLRVPRAIIDDQVTSPPPSVTFDQFQVFRVQGTSLLRKCNPLGPYCRPMSKLLGGSQGGGRFLMGEVPQHTSAVSRKIEELTSPSIYLP